jgi:hypothetical protein
MHDNLPVAVGELEGVGQEVQKDLQYPSLVPINLLQHVHIAFRVDLGHQLDVALVRCRY